VELALTPNPYGGIIEARIDNGPWQTFDLRATDPSVQHRVTIAKNLWDNDHHAEVRVKQGELLLDGVVVKTTTFGMRQIAALTALGIALLSMVLIGLLWFFARRKNFDSIGVNA
jgi:hypothetical protein